MTTELAVPEATTKQQPAMYRAYPFTGRLEERDLVQAVANYRRHETEARQIAVHIAAGTQVYFTLPPGVEIRYSEKAQPGTMYLQTVTTQAALFPARGRAL
jgi:hypothetical protein